MKQITILLLMLSILILTATPTAAQDGRNRAYGFLMLEEPVSPRSAAMGSAGTALGSGGFRYYNPAQPFFAPSSFAAAEFGQMPGGVNKGGFESALIFPDWFSAVSFYSSSVDFETRDERGFGSRASSSTTIGAMSVGYIRDNLALALSANILSDRIWVESSYNATSFSAGVGYKFLDDKLNIGAAGFNLIVRSEGVEGCSGACFEQAWVPLFARAGAAWTDTLKSFPYTVAADIVYRDEDGTFTMPVGVEVSVLPYINLRLGKRIGWDNEILSLGIGLNIDNLSFDAAFIPTVFVSDYEIKWSMGFTYRMGGKRKEKTVPEARIGAISKPEPEVIEPEAADEPEVIEVIEVIESTEEEQEAVESADDELEESAESTEEGPSEPAELPEESETKEPADDEPESTEPEAEVEAEQTEMPEN